ncbi:MAG: TolC family protein [Candidatus Korobacteraceae bacterium]
MQVRQFCGGLLITLLALPAVGQQLSGGAAPVAVPQSLDQLLQSGNQSPFTGSVPGGGLPAGTLDLTVQDAIDRSLKYNLGIVLSSQNSAAARAEHLKQLSNLLPQLNGSLREGYAKVNLEAEGLDLKSFNIPGLGNSVQFSNSEARVSASEDLVDFNALEKTRAASADVRAAGFTYDSARETVTLSAAASYLLVISAQSQVEAATADLKTAESLYQLAKDREAAGLNPEIDTLRARVEAQVRRQNLIEANNNLAKQRITLLRVLGLPLHQSICLVSRVPYKPLPQVMEAEEFQRALAVRPDYLAAEQQVKAAELRRKAAQAEHLPSLGISGDYGVIGTRPDNAFPTWTVNAGLKIPIFEGGKITADIRKADADLAQAKAQRDDLKGRIEQDIADALLDVSSAAEQVEVAEATLQYAQQTLTQSQDRFSAGVTNNIEVIQAQEAVANANQQFIASLFSHNIAKVLLARAVGTAEQSVRRALEEDSGAAAPGQNPTGAGANGAEQSPAASGAPAPK